MPIERTTEEYRTTTTTSRVGLTVDNKQLVRLLGVHNYISQLANVVLKEFIQNSFDAVRSSYQKKELAKGDGYIDVSLETKSRTITVTDNGVGMTPETVKNIFLRVGTSLKEALSTEERSGGFGLAKLAFLFAGREVTLHTVRNGTETFLQTNGIELLNGTASLNTKKVNEANGTSISIILPEHIEVSSGDCRYITFPRSLDAATTLKLPLMGDVYVKARMNNEPKEILPLGRCYNYNATPLSAIVETEWGHIDIYMSKNPVPTAQTKKSVLSAGLHQFNNLLLSGVPYHVVMDVKPSVSADSPNYPFNKQREGWSVPVALDVRHINDAVKKVVFIKEAASLAAIFDNMKLIKRIGDSFSFVRPPFINRSSPEMLLQKPIKFFIANGSVKVDLNIEAFNSVIRNEKSGSDNLSFIVTESPVYLSYYNIDPIIEAAKRTGRSPKEVKKCLGKFAYITHDFLKKITHIPEIMSPRVKNPLFGIHFHKLHRGENIATPQDTIFINPARDIGKSPAAWAHGWVHTGMHEVVHWKNRGHDAPFIADMGGLYSVIEDYHPNLYMTTMCNLQKLATENWSIFQAFREINNDPSVQNIGPREAQNDNVVANAAPKRRRCARPFNSIGKHLKN